MVADKAKTEEHLKKAREVMHQVKTVLGIKLGIRVADYDGTTYKTKFDDGTSNFIFKSIPREYFDDKDTLEVHADYWVVLFKEVQEELNKRKRG